MLDGTLNKLAYFGDEEDGYSRYVLFLDDRPVMWVFVNKDEESKPIYVSKAEENAPRIKTQGRAFWDAENGHVDGVSIQFFVYPRIGWLLADLFIPKDGK